MVVFMKRISPFGCALSAMLLLGCGGEADYPQLAKAFHAQYARSRAVAALSHYNIKFREQDLYIHECQSTPEDTVKTWAVYENYLPEEKFDLAKLEVAQTPFSDASGRRIIPEYQTLQLADTAGAGGKSILRLRDAVQAFHQLGLREVICGGPNVTYLVRPKFMLIFVADSSQTPESIKNIATRLDGNWYYEISFAHQDEQRRRLLPFLREFFESLQAKKSPP